MKEVIMVLNEKTGEETEVASIPDSPIKNYVLWYCNMDCLLRVINIDDAEDMGVNGN